MNNKPKFIRCGDSVFNAEFVHCISKAVSTNKPLVYMIKVYKAGSPVQDNRSYSLIHFDNKAQRDEEFEQILANMNT